MCLFLSPRYLVTSVAFSLRVLITSLFEEAVGYPVTFVQDNHSKSSKGVLRGLHYQLPLHAQGKLVRCVAGEVFDVAVDIRKSSPTFGQWVGVSLSAENKRQLWIPEGFAHGFITRTETAEFFYKTTRYYQPEFEREIYCNDLLLSIYWGNKSPVFSPENIKEKSFSMAGEF